MRKEIIEDLENEIWIKNNGYEVSNKGRIIGKKGKLLKGNPAKDGYVTCSIKFEDGFYAGSYHRAVAYLFVPNPDPINKIEVNHKDGIKHHNYDTNLEWVTKKENQQHESDVLKQRNCEKHWGTILTEDKVKEIYNLCKEGNLLYKEIAELYEIYPQEVSDIARGKLWRDLELEPLPKVIRGSRRNGKKGYTEHTYNN